MAHIQPPSSPEKNWFQITLELLGMPMPWTRSPKLIYTDSQLYPLHPTSKTPAWYRRSDTALTKDGRKLKPLRVQAAEYLKDEPNSTWQRHSINEVSTITMKISKLPLIAKARFESMFKDKEWVLPVSWTWYLFLWIFAFAAMIIWFVSTCPLSWVDEN